MTLSVIDGQLLSSSKCDISYLYTR